MSFKLKSLAVALALVASVPAHAALDDSFGVNGSSVMLGLFDATANKSAVFDLGINYANLFNNGQASFNLALNSGDYATAWSAFGVGANTQWAVFSSDGDGGAVSGDIGMITSMQGTTFGPTVTGQNLGDTAVGFDAYTAELNAQPNHSTVTNGASIGTPGTGTGYLDPFIWGLGGNRFGGQGSIITGNLGQTLNVIQTLSTGALANATTRSILGDGGNNSTFNLNSSGALVYTQGLAAVLPPVTAAVPEADPLAMMMVGLGLMGFVARRRKQA